MPPTAPAGAGAVTRPAETSPSASLPGPTPVRVGAVVAGAALLFVVLRLLAIGGDVTLFVRAGDALTDPAQATMLTVDEDGSGYDGQFSYRIARAPLSAAERVDGVAFDRPVDRVARIGYPALVWAVSLGGQSGLVPWALIAVNVAACGVIGALGAVLARDAGRSTWWGLLPAAAPGLLVATARDLTEVVAAAALLGAVVLLRRGRYGPAALVMAAAVLTRETTLVLPVAVAAVAVLRHLPSLPGALDRVRRTLTADDRAVPLWVGAIPIAVYAVWQVALRTLWDAPAPHGPDVPVNGLTVPLLRPLGQAVSFLTDGDVVSLVQVIQLLLVGAGVVLVAMAAWRAADLGGPERVAIGLAVVLLVSLSTWDRAVVFLRYPTDVLVLGAAALPAVPALSGRAVRVAVPLFALSALMWVGIA